MRRFVATLLTVVLATTIEAQSLDECRRLAREHYPEIKQYDLISQTEQYNLSNAARAWIPQVALSGQATYQTATPTYPDVFKTILQANGVEMAGIRKEQYKVAIDVTQNIWDGGASSASRAVYEAEAEEQRSRVDVALYDVQTRVDNLYFGILLLDEQMAQTEALIEVLNSNLARMRTYYKNGVAMQSDVDAVEAELLTARQNLGQIDASRSSYRRMLEVFIGCPLTTDKLERPMECELTSRHLARPELDLFAAQEYKLQAQRSIINASVMPQFTAFAQGYYGYPGMDLFKSMVSSKGSFNAIVGVRMSWNIGSFYTKKNNVAKLNTAQQQIAVERDIFLFNTQMQTLQEDGEIARLHKAIEDDKRIVELRSRVRKAAESQLDNGVIDTTDLLRKITDETNAILARSIHEIELLQAIYRLKTTLNQ